MDNKRKSSRRTSKKTNDVKLQDKNLMNPTVLRTPPSVRSCVNLYSPQPDENDDLYYSEESSPVLLSTQEGGRGCEVTWDWRSPNRNINVSNITPKARKRKPNKYKLKSISPLLCLPTNKQYRKPMNTNFFQNLQEQLADIQRRFNSNKQTSIYDDTSHNKEETATNNKMDTCSTEIIKTATKMDVCPTENIKDEVKQVSLKNQNSPDISEYLKDDSFTDLLIQCSQVAENALKKGVDLTKLETIENITENFVENVEPSLSPDLFMDEGIALNQVETPTLVKTTKKTSTKNISIAAIGSPKIALSTPKKFSIDREEYINDDSFDAILSTIGDEAFFTDSTSILQTKQILNNNIHKEVSNATEMNISKQNMNTGITRFNAIQKSDTKSNFSRHSSMPVSPQIIENKCHLGSSFSRHNSMPYNCNKNLRQHGMGGKGESSESLGYNSCSPIQCTPDEIEKKRQEALKRKEVARMRKEIERKRLEAIEKLQTKSKNKNLKSCR